MYTLLFNKTKYTTMNTEIRFASEKQINLINKFATEEQFGYEPSTRVYFGFKYSAGMPCSELADKDLRPLTSQAASDIISDAIDYIRNLGSYNKYMCDTMTTKFVAYAFMLTHGFNYVSKCSIISTENEDEYKVTFEHDGISYIFFIVCGHIKRYVINGHTKEDSVVVEVPDAECDVDAIETELNKYKTIEVTDCEGNEDWYREGSGAYYEDIAEMQCGSDFC